MKTTARLLLIIAAAVLQSCSTAKLSPETVSTSAGYFNIKATPEIGGVLIWKKSTESQKGSVIYQTGHPPPSSYVNVDAYPSGKLRLEVNRVGDITFGGPIATDLGAQAELKASLKRFLTFKLSGYTSRTLLAETSPGRLLGSAPYRGFREELVDTAVVDSDDYRLVFVIRDIYAERTESKVGSGPASDDDKNFLVKVENYNVSTTVSNSSSALGENSYAIVDFAVFRVVSDPSIKDRIPGALGINFVRDFSYDPEQFLKDYLN